ncbi:MAG: hypothetical protein HOB79_13410 [Rhodospirillaceae bacterium]|nr:hypothetical protein [Rhodospirillales bacterium]MBT3904979.1 hypothetical protein [Rhodospirillaceae bacterium]MBT4702061.1 hypothetical protein [Rhodospirillaceae bacterium]MBT5033978.1 hypothetical protein [Rhodospirillaceae bacterium]MBT6222069.1 hypothetical protein [Rhodospirillaceae bacterium]
MGGLGHFLERAGFATTQISLVREHTLQINPPRALLTPFELGRPFGAPNEPEFQKRVLVETLNLLTRDKGPVLEEWTEAAPGPKADLEGWTCPVDFGPGMDAVDVNVDPFTAVMQEIDKLRPWHDTAEKKLGRTTFGIANLELDVIVRYLVDFIEDTDAPLPLSGMPRYQAVKLCIDDLKAFYFESALAQPGVATDFELANWYYAETIVSDMLVRLNSVCAATDDAVLKRMSIRGIIPAHQAHRKNSC